MTHARDVLVEVVLLRGDPEGRLDYRFLTAPLPMGSTPDELALTLSGLAKVGPGAVCHSTSWRYEKEALVLTYAGLPDRGDAPTRPLLTPSVVASTDALRPTPDGLHEHHVAAHAVRHLAFLAGTDPAIAAAARCEPVVWRTVQRVARDMRVGPHDALHGHVADTTARDR